MPAEPGRRTQAQRREATRRALVEAGSTMFERHGYHGISVEAIAQRAGYTKGAAYGHFANKDELFLAVYDSRIEERAGFVSALAQAEGPAVQRLRAVVEAYVGVVAASRGWSVALLEFLAHAARREPLLAALRERDDRLRRLLADAVRPLAQEAGVPTGTYADAALLVVNGILLEHVQDPRRPPPELAAAIAAAVHRSLAPELGHD